jgi:hypothetical protein
MGDSSCCCHSHEQGNEFTGLPCWIRRLFAGQFIFGRAGLTSWRVWGERAPVDIAAHRLRSLRHLKFARSVIDTEANERVTPDDAADSTVVDMFLQSNK